MNPFKGVTFFVGWLTSSLAGIGAILYACGYLIARAQLNLLGLFGSFEYSHEYYLREGGKFFVVLAMELVGPAALIWLVYGGYLLLLSLLLLLPLLIFIYVKRAAFGAMRVSLRDQLIQFVERRAWFWRSLAFASLFLLFTVHFIGNLNQFNGVLSISNLLYMGLEDLQSVDPSARKLAQWLLKGDESELRKHFSSLLFGGFQAGLLLAAVWYVVAAWPARFWLASLFIVNFMMYLIFLPMAYGVLVRPTKYPLIAVSSDAPLLPNAAQDLFLLDTNDHEFILWEPASKRVLWIPKSHIKSAEIKQAQFLFKRTPAVINLSKSRERSS
jgi:hypothetical protein